MTPLQIHLVRTTFATVARNSPRLAASFYRCLFQRDPTLRPMFRGDLEMQGRKRAYGLAAAAMKSRANVCRQSPLARQVDEARSVMPMLAPQSLARLDSVTLHQHARNHRSRLIGDLIARAAAAVGAAAGGAFAALAPRSAKRHAGSDVI